MFTALLMHAKSAGHRTGLQLARPTMLEVECAPGVVLHVILSSAFPGNWQPYFKTYSDLACIP